MTTFNFDCRSGSECYRVTINADSAGEAIDFLNRHLFEIMRPDVAYTLLDSDTDEYGLIFSNIAHGTQTIVDQTIERSRAILARYMRFDLLAEATKRVVEKPIQSNGIKNQWGRLVPPPCREIDSAGRDLDKIYRWIKPSDDLGDTSTLDRLNAIEETPSLNEQREARLIAMYDAETSP